MGIRNLFFKKFEIHSQEAVYPTYGPSSEYKLSRADFWMLMSIAAIDNAVGQSNRDCSK